MVRPRNRLRPQYFPSLETKKGQHCTWMLILLISYSLPRYAYMYDKTQVDAGWKGSREKHRGIEQIPHLKTFAWSICKLRHFLFPSTSFVLLIDLPHSSFFYRWSIMPTTLILDSDKTKVKKAVPTSVMHKLASTPSCPVCVTSYLILVN